MHAEIVSRLEEVIKYLKPLLPLANCHMSMWEKHVPEAIQKEISSVTVQELDTVFFHFMKDSLDAEVRDNVKILIEKVPEFSNFLSIARDMSFRGSLLQKIITSHSEFNDKLTTLGWKVQDTLFMEQFMSYKKMHEVQVMSDIVAALANIKHASHVIDIGGGKGYLSSFLSLYHGLKILGKVWNGLCRRAILLKQGSIPPRRGKHWRSHNEQSAENAATSNSVLPTSQNSSAERIDLYKQVTKFVTPHTDLVKMVKEQFTEDECRNLSIVGLHTCGDLAPSCFRLFRNRPEVASICNIGCCYHLMEEQFSRNPFWDEVDPPLATGMYGFPLSDFLNSKELSLGRNARMLATQAVDRLQENNQVQSESLFYRALLQVVLIKNSDDFFPWGQVGRLTAKTEHPTDGEIVESVTAQQNDSELDDDMDIAEDEVPQLKPTPSAVQALDALATFHCYIQGQSSVHEDVIGAVNLLENFVENRVNEEEIETIYKEHFAEKNLLHIFFLLRVSLAPVIEAVILLDRLLYLHEQGYHNSYLIRLFDPVISPRCYCITAFKNDP
ncbi:hypothetical protein C0J52_15058 [Blattella germanica]|nr:hypothetical protein C0J52_15058 [Blattella germanica]